MTAVSGAAEEKYLLVKGSSGLGNRMLCALTGVLYARLTGRKLIVDWSDPVYSDDGSDVFHRFFACPSAGAVEDLPETASVAPKAWRGHLHDSAQAVQREYDRSIVSRAYRRLGRAGLVRKSVRAARLQRDLSVDTATLVHQAQVAVLWAYSERIDRLRPHFRGEFGELARMSTPAILRTLLERDLLLHPLIRARVEEFRAAHLHGPTVGVHLRLSDRRVRVEAILAELNGLLAREPGLTVFGATDNVEAAELLARRYPGAVTTPHWYPPPGKSQHNNPQCPDRVENGVEALVDLYLLGGCDYLIGDRTSTFTRVAALLLPEPDGRLVDVRPAASRRTRISRELWRRHAASDSLAAAIVRVIGKGQYPQA